MEHGVYACMVRNKTMNISKDIICLYIIFASSFPFSYFPFRLTLG